MEEMSNDHRKTLLSDTSLKNTLRAKSRHRREQLTGLAAASSAAAHPLRNDVLPKLELVELAPGDLVLPTRKLRKNEAAHIGEVATAISSLGFCDPVLIDQHNGVLDGMIRVEAAKLLGLPYIPLHPSQLFHGLGRTAGAASPEPAGREGKLGSR